MKTRLFSSLLVLGPMAALMFTGLTGCGPSYPNCETDENCKAHNEVCVNGTCHKCRDKTQCTPQMGPCATCEEQNFTCQKPKGNLGDCCVTDADCQNSKCWKSTPDAQSGVCSQCAVDKDCNNPKLKCVQGSCVPKAECETDADCGQGRRCDNGTCVAVSCNLQPVYFDFDQSDLRSDARDTLASDKDCMDKMGYSVRLEGNCDERGSDEYNLTLGQRRADAVKSYLVNLGVAAGKLSTISYGEERPKCTEHNEECWQQNRRVDLNPQ